MQGVEQTAFFDERFELQFIYPRIVYEHPVEYEEEQSNGLVTVRLPLTNDEMSTLKSHNFRWYRLVRCMTGSNTTAKR